jgi:hypothetical protein
MELSQDWLRETISVTKRPLEDASNATAFNSEMHSQATPASANGKCDANVMLLPLEQSR